MDSDEDDITYNKFVLPNGAIYKKKRSKCPNPRDHYGWLKLVNKENEKFLKLSQTQPDKCIEEKNKLTYKKVMAKIEGKPYKDDVQLLTKSIMRNRQKKDIHKQKWAKRIKAQKKNPKVVKRKKSKRHNRK